MCQNEFGLKWSYMTLDDILCDIPEKFLNNKNISQKKDDVEILR